MIRAAAVLLAMVAFPCAAVDLARAVVIAPAGFSSREKRAVAMLVQEVEKRTGIRWTVAHSEPDGAPAAISIQRGSGPPEGYTIAASARGVSVVGNDERGILFGIGRLLRALHLKRGSAALDESFHITTAPRSRLRGHQLGYRPKTNSYDAWPVATWEQYIRDLAVFGANAIELIPPRSDDAPDSPHFPLPPMRMMTEMSRLADQYGLDVWIWYPALDPDYSDAAAVARALHEWGAVFRQLPRVNAVFVPGGDPGHTRPNVLMALLERQTEVLRRYHPEAQMWVSPQGFSEEWLNEFLTILKQDQPAWLSGVVYGPQVRVPLAELRAEIPQRYPIRHYPDITHSRQCQYPVPDWDAAYAVTEGREVINPRPLDQARIFRLTAPFTIGFLTYSEGCNDDVNKAIWSGLGWDPDAGVHDLLRDYARYFIGDDYAEPFAEGLLALERNWRGPLRSNAGVETTLARFRDLERRAPYPLRRNWRFQQALYRAYYDAYVRRRLLHETALESEAMSILRDARPGVTMAAMARAEAAFAPSGRDPETGELRSRIFELAEALFQSIGMQLSVSRYGAIAVGRGANLDTLDVPLNNRAWLEQRFKRLRQRESEADRLHGLGDIAAWSDPGPGGYYDDLGNPARQPHLVRDSGASDDPAFFHTPLTGFAYDPFWRSSWWDHAETLYDQPLKMHYNGLDPAAYYKIRVVYAGDAADRRVRLDADGGIEVHPYLKKPAPPRPLEFDIPQQATASGSLDLSWRAEPGLGGSGRGCQVAEVWLIRK